VKALAEKGIDEAKIRFADGESIEDLEIEIEFWLAVDDCAICDEQLCSAHYDRFFNCL
jgi:hypothetical protein